MEYPSNSELSKKQEAQKEEKVINKVNLSGSVGTRKKSAVEKFAGAFIQDDLDNVKQYIVSDVIIPTIKDTILNTISMFFYGETRANPRGHVRSSSPMTKVSYTSYFDDKYGTRPTQPKRSVTSSGFEYEDLLFDNRGDAELLLQEMENTLERYHTISVFDMYDMAGEVAPFTYQNYGWTSLRNARVTQVHGGQYIIEMPRALPMK